MATVNAELIKRSQLRHFLNVTPKAATPLFAFMNKGITDQSIATNPENDSEQYIGEDNATTFPKSFAPVIDGEQTAYRGDPVFDYIDTLGFLLATGADAQSQLIEARLYRAADDKGPYPAKKSNVNIVVNSYGGAASDPNRHTFTVNLEGDPVFGYFDLDTLEFTEDDSVRKELIASLAGETAGSQGAPARASISAEQGTTDTQSARNK